MNSTVLELPVFVDVGDVMNSMKCSRSAAYAHMRTALGRPPGQRGQLRVPVYVWQRYVRSRFDPATRSCDTRDRARPRKASSIGRIAVTRPRTKSRITAAETDDPSR